ncbi:Imm39 family immunity protein [Sphingomonas sp. Leaf17]|uniref:Imm39 family immunity protein n=1 Tax=Sphingomonas sp. Leaf17 TaxID=1735683 RepID=UPI0009EA62CE|nr:Imm39 family immunity protein [Sphingomonas sp. Leaf17]
MHNRKLVLGSVALTKARLPAKAHAAALNKIRDDLEREIIESGYLAGSPFTWIGLIIREGLVDEIKPHLREIDEKDGELPAAIEINTHTLIGASQDRIEVVYRKAALVSLIHIAARFELDANRFESLLR